MRGFGFVQDSQLYSVMNVNTKFQISKTIIDRWPSKQNGTAQLIYYLRPLSRCLSSLVAVLILLLALAC